MKIVMRYVVMLSITLLPFALKATSVEEIDKPGSHRSKTVVDGATYWLIVTPEPRTLVKQFDSAEKGTTLNVNAVTSIKRGGELGFAILLSGCKAAESTGKCDVIATYRIYLPDGAMAVERTNLPVWTGIPPEKLDLGKAVWATTSEPTDPLGNNVIRAVITDRVSKRTIILDQSFKLIP